MANQFGSREQRVPLKTVAFQKGIQELKRFGVSSQYLFEQLS